MTNWPTAPLIRIKRGLKIEDDIVDEVAIQGAQGNYLTRNHVLYSTGVYNEINEWEEITPVPTAALKRLQDAFRGIDVIESLEPPLLEVLSHLPASKPNPIDRAVTRVKDIKGAPMVDAGSTQEERLSLLLDALASVQGATRKTAPLTMVTRICADWTDAESKRGDSLEATRRRVEALSGLGDFIVLSTLVADVITAMSENIPPRHDLIDAAAYALAWAAQIIEEEEDR